MVNNVKSPAAVVEAARVRRAVKERVECCARRREEGSGPVYCEVYIYPTSSCPITVS